MKPIKQTLMSGAIMLALSLAFTSCEDILGEWDKPAPAVVTPTPEPETPPTPEAIIYAFSLRNLADDADVVATALKVTDQAGTEIATATSDGKYTIKKDDLGSATVLWLEATTATGKYIQKVKIEELPAIAEAGKLTMATLGNIIGADGKFYANKTAADAATTTGVAMIVYLGNEGETSTKFNRGLAIALKNDGNTYKWGPTATNTSLENKDTWSTASADMAGIANTTTLQGLGVDYQAAMAPIPYDMAVFDPIPNGFSGWFLPSAGQWYKFLGGMCGLTWTDFGWASGTGSDNFNAVNKTFTDAGYDTTDAKFESGDWYWSSSEYGDDNAVCVRFGSSLGVSVYGGGKGSDGRVRSFLAF